MLSSWFPGVRGWGWALWNRNRQVAILNFEGEAYKHKDFCTEIVKRTGSRIVQPRQQWRASRHSLLVLCTSGGPGLEERRAMDTLERKMTRGSDATHPAPTQGH